MKTLCVGLAVGAFSAVIALSAGAFAGEITETSFGVAGGFTIPSGDNLGDTNSITVTNGGLVTVTAPDPYSLSGLVTLGETGTMQSFTNLSSPSPISDFLVLASGVTLSMQTLSVVSQVAGPPGYIDLSGIGTLSAPGFDPTTGTYSFTGTTTDNLTFSFAVETSASSSGVPEPVSLSLFGFGLAALGIRRRAALRS